MYKCEIAPLTRLTRNVEFIFFYYSYQLLSAGSMIFKNVLSVFQYDRKLAEFLLKIDSTDIDRQNHFILRKLKKILNTF